MIDKLLIIGAYALPVLLLLTFCFYITKKYKLINIYNTVFVNISSFSIVDLIIISIFFLSVGSFCSSIIYRLAPNSPFPLFKIRSSCPSCLKKIDAINLIPLLGFVIQSGKCKFCNSNISKFYPFTEIFFLLIGILPVSYTHLTLPTI